MNKGNIIIILLIILIIIKITNISTENFIYMKRVYGQGGTCNDYIPDYTSCKNVPTDNTFDYQGNVEFFECPCNKSRYYPNQYRPNVTYTWEGFEQSHLTSNIKFKLNDKYFNITDKTIAMDLTGFSFNLEGPFIKDQSNQFVKIIYPTNKIELSPNRNSEQKDGVGFSAPLLYNDGYLFTIYKKSMWFLSFDQDYNVKWTKDKSNASIFNIIM